MIDIATLGLEVRSDGVVVASDRLKTLTNEGRRAESTTSSLSSATDKLAGYLKAAAAALASWKLADLIKDATLLAARVETLGVVLKVVGNNAGYTGAQMDGFVNQVRKMGITTQESMNSLIKMAGAQMDLTKASQLARVAQDAAVIGNINSSEAFGRMIQGIRSGEVEILKTIGISVQFEQGYKQLAATLGKTTEQLSATEKTASRMNQVLDYGKNIAGAYEASMGTAGKMVNSMARFTEELKLSLGALGLPTFTLAVDDLTAALKRLNEQAGANKSELATFGSDIADAYRYVRNELGMVAGDIDRIGANLTKTLQIMFKIAEVSTRFMTLGQFGDGLRDAADRQGRNSDMFAQKYRDRLADNAAYQASRSTGPVLDSSEAARLKMMQDRREGSKIDASNAQKELQAAEARKAAAAAGAQAAERWRATYSDLRKEISALNPSLTEQERAVAEVTNRYDDLAGKKGANVTLLKELKKEHLDAVNGYYAVAAAIKATSDEFQEYLRLAESEPPQNNEAGDMNLRWEEELKLLKSLQPSADLDKLNEQIAMFERLMSDIPSKAPEVAAAIASLKQEFADASGLTSLLMGNKELETSLIGKGPSSSVDDRIKMERQQIQDRYDFEREQMEKSLKRAEKDADKRAAIEKRLSLLKREYDLDMAENTEKSTKSSLAMTASYTGMAGDLFAALASTQDQSSRKGFETAKAFNIAATVMSTASAIMAQLSGPDGWTPIAWARSAMAGALGAIQLANIASTSFGGGAGKVSAPTASAGSFGGAGGGNSVGSGIGQSVRTPGEMQTEESLQNLAAASENASLAISKVADGLTNISDLFQEGGLFGTAVSNAPGVGVQVSEHAGRTDWNMRDIGVIASVIDGVVKAKQFNYYENAFLGGKTESTRTGFEDTLQSAIDKVRSTIELSSVAIGTRSDASRYSLTETTLSFANATEEEARKIVEAFISKVANEMAMTVEGLQDYAFFGEGAFDALVRLSTSLQGVNEMMELTGHTLVNSTLQGADAAYRLADAFGGLDKMTDAVDEYFQGMFTEAERNSLTLAQSTRETGAAFNEMGITAPRTRQEFRSLVNSLDLTTDAGAGLYVALMNIAPAFAEMLELTENIERERLESVQDLQSRYLRVTKNADAELYDLRIEQEREYQDYVERGLDTTRLATVQQLEYAEAVKATAEAAREASDKLRSTMATTALSAANALQSILGGNLSTLSPEDLYRQKLAAFTSAKADGKNDQLGQLGQELLSASRGYNASGAGYVADYDMVLKTLSDIAGMQGSPTLDAAQQQVDLLTKIRDNTGLTVTATTTMTQIMGKQIADSIIRMAAGLETPNLAYDLDKNGRITSSDALLYLQSLPKLASGGITSGISIAGEIPEAVIPLPDGRTVPVKLYADNYGDNSEMIAELRALREEVVELRKVAGNIDGNTAAGTRTAQAGFSEMVELGEESNRINAQDVQQRRLANFR